MKKKCSKCGEEKELFDFYKSKGQHKFGVMAWCKLCYCEESKTIHAKAGRNRYYLKTYNITEEEYKLKKEKQGGRCEICKNKSEKLYVDHNHNTNAVRGLLCANCNAALGMFMEKMEFLENAKKYLEKYE